MRVIFERGFAETFEEFSNGWDALSLIVRKLSDQTERARITKKGIFYYF
jgi:hypothetical protein